MDEKFETPPVKQTFSIGEVADMLGIPAHTIRFWEKTFNFIVPKKESGRRVFTRSDISKLKRIHKLRYQENLQIPGVRKKLQEEGLIDESSHTAHSKLDDPVLQRKTETNFTRSIGETNNGSDKIATSTSNNDNPIYTKQPSQNRMGINNSNNASIIEELKEIKNLLSE